MSTTLTEAALRLLNARLAATATLEALAARRAAFDAETAPLVAEKARREADIAQCEADVKALARAHYDATGDKTPLTGVEVKLYNTMAYADGDALAWAKRTNMALVPESLDRKAFEKIAAAAPLDFVTYGKEPRVTLGKRIEITVAAETPAATTGGAPF